MNLNLPDFAALRILVVGDLMLTATGMAALREFRPKRRCRWCSFATTKPAPAGPATWPQRRLAGRPGIADRHRRAGRGRRGAGPQPRRRGVDCRLLTPPGARTITKPRVISRHQQLIRLDFEDGFAAAHTEALPEAFAKALEGVDAVILSDYAKGTLQNVEPLIRLARERGLPVIVDPKAATSRAMPGPPW